MANLYMHIYYYFSNIKTWQVIASMIAAIVVFQDLTMNMEDGWRLIGIAVVMFFVLVVEVCLSVDFRY